MTGKHNGESQPPQEPEGADAQRARILGETAKIAWTELQRFFAQGIAIAVDPQLDLVEVACRVTEDDKHAVEAWIKRGQFGPVTDAQAQEWLAANALMWAVVVKPWILVQPVLQQTDESPAADSKA